MNFYTYLALFFLGVIFFFNCSSSSHDNAIDYRTAKNNLMEAQKALIRKDADSIRKVIKANGWSMIETRTGLWYEILETGSGEPIDLHDVVFLEYTVSLLDGTICYQSDSLKPKHFKVGHGGVESGLEEGILRLRNGAKARFIMPPHLAHGVIGDQNKIPRLAIIVYNVEVVDHYKYEPKD